MSSEQDHGESILLPDVEPRWDAARTERALGAVHSRLRTAKRVKTLALAMTGACIAALASWKLLPVQGNEVASRPAVQESAAQVAGTSRLVHFKDGSSVRLETQESELKVGEVSDSVVNVELKRGAGQFSVVPKQARAFSVRSGVVTVHVIGTEFRVQSLGASAAVEVSRGVVRVSWPTGSSLLHEGERGIFPPPEAKTETPSEVPSAANTGPEQSSDEAATAAERQAPRQPKSEELRVLAKRRDYKAAYKLLVSTPTVVGASSADLLLAADVARLSGHPAEAVPYLERLLASHPRSSEAPLAAFTLGRTLMGLGQNTNAISAFGRARSLAPTGPLAEDALVRQIEAASRASNRELAKKLGEQYERNYPNGRKLQIVRGYTGQTQ